MSHTEMEVFAFWQVLTFLGKGHGDWKASNRSGFIQTMGNEKKDLYCLLPLVVNLNYLTKKEYFNAGLSA